MAGGSGELSAVLYNWDVVQRLLKYTNILIVVLLVLALGVVGWFGWRTAPVVDGSIQAPIASAGRIARDALGMPHIEARSVDDVLFLQGYATASDRLWQMDAMRRATAGELSEVIGSAALPLDIRARRIGFKRTALVQEKRMDPRDRALFAAYARGVNHFIDTHRDKLPPEFAILQYEPRPWSISDSILVALRMASDLSTTFQSDLDRERMRAEVAKTYPELSEEGLGELMRILFPRRNGEEILAGSNAWVIAGSRTASGKPLLANDTHLGVNFPSTWHMVHLNAGLLDVAGLTLPGLPGVIIGHNQRIAWGVTNLQVDVQDLFEERIDLASGRYQYGQELRQANRIAEVIRVKGAADIRLNVFVTQHGPLIFTANEEPLKRNLALQWNALDPDFVSYPILELNLAQNWEQFRRALSRFPGPSQNFVYADVDGNIGYQATGKIPLRLQGSGGVPVPGYTGQFEWTGYLPFDALPSLYNPPSGRIVTANQNPFPPDYGYPYSGRFDDPDRANQIVRRLDARNGWTPEGMLEIQKDVYSPYYAFLAREIVQAAERKTPGDAFLNEAVKLLKEWNGQAELDQPAAAIARLFAIDFRLALLKKLAPEWEQADVIMDSAVVKHFLRSRSPLLSEDYDAWLLEVFGKTLATQRERLGGDLRNWRYGEVLRWNVEHPVFSRIPLLGRYLSIGRVQMSGSSSSPKQVGSNAGPSERFVADLSDWENSLCNIMQGVSGHPFSGHYKDQWKAFYYGESFPLPYRQLSADSVLEVTPQPR